MLRHKNEIEKLTLRQKTALLTQFDRLSDSGINSAGIPRVKRAELDDLVRESEYPAYSSIINCWDSALIEQMTTELALRAREAGYNFLVTPDLKAVSNPYKEGLSEDAFLNGKAGAAISRAVKAAGAACCLEGLYLGEEDVEFLDMEQDRSAVCSLFEMPFFYALEDTSCDAVGCSMASAGCGYAFVNAELFDAAAGGRYGKDAFVVGRDIAPDTDFHDFLNGNTCIGGATLALDRAAVRYTQLKEYIAEGGATDRDLQVAIADGKAISQETIDSAVDGVIAFAHRVSSRRPAAIASPAENTVAEAARASIVLLKNNGVLPIRKGASVAVIGDFRNWKDEIAAYYPVSGTAAGYETLAERSDDLLFAAGEAAKSADVVVAVLEQRRTTDRAARSLMLPANRLALIDTLRSNTKKLIAVIVGDAPVDLSFDACCSAVLMVPSGGASCAKALAEVLSGAYNPSGRLARTCYDGGDAFFAQLKDQIRSGTKQVGSLSGYRYLASEKLRVRYPFGYGLSYTRFSYSSLRIDGTNVTFTIKNTGRRDGVETAQVYVAYGCGGVKELKGFAKVSLKAGESKTVRVSIPPVKLQSDETGRQTECRTVYVGSSSQNIKLKGTMGGMVHKLASVASAFPTVLLRFVKGGAKMPSAFRMSAVSDGEKGYETYSPGAVMGAIFLIAAILTMVISASCYVFLGAQFLIWQWVLVAGAGGLVLVEIAVYIAMKLHREKLLHKLDAEDEKKQFLSDAKSAVTPEGAFEDAFEKTQSAVQTSEPVREGLHYYEKGFTFSLLSGQLKTFFSERGLLAENNVLFDLIGALTCSRLLLVPGKYTEQMYSMCRVLAEYFGCASYRDNAAGVAQAGGLFVVRDRNGMRSTNLRAAVEQASRNTRVPHVAAVGHICGQYAQELLGTLAWGLEQHGGNPAHFEAYADGLSAVHSLPPNLWIVAAVDGDIDSLSETLTEIATVFIPDFLRGPVSSETSLCKPLSYFQFENMRRLVREQFPLEEQFWKRVDRLEEGIAGMRPYRVGNRLWNKMEIFASAFAASGGTEADALDGAVACCLLAGVFTDRQDKEYAGQVLAELEAALGEEQTTQCKRMMQLLQSFGEQPDPQFKEAKSSE